MVAKDSQLHRKCHVDLPSALSAGLSVAAQTPPPWLLECVTDALHAMATETWYESLFSPAAGKMFGVLAVKSDTDMGYLMGFSGMLNGSWIQPGFVPPVFDVESVEALLSEGEKGIIAYTLKLTESGLLDKHRAAREQMDELKRESKSALTRMQYSLSRRKQHRKLHRQRLTESQSAANLDWQSQQDKKFRKATRRKWQSRLELAQETFEQWEAQYHKIEWQRAALSRKLQSAVFAHYQLCNSDQELQSMISLFSDGLPPAGAGDCAAPKLLHYANLQGYQILGLAEFWVGASPESNVRRHGYFYQPCKAKCGPLMPWLTANPARLRRDQAANPKTKEPESRDLNHKNPKLENGGWNDASANLLNKKPAAIDIVYEDDSIVVIVKPVGLLSTPGKTIQESVYTQLTYCFPSATGPLLVHRLDMDTSGLLLVAKHPRAHKALQRQFINRTIEKRYLAILDGLVGDDSGVISLPLRVDLDDRPRQLVCPELGKSATTRFTVLKRENGLTRVAFEPVTGRTHQIRVHAAHVLGLHTPIVGDPLYGRVASRMMLHAESIGFKHPESGQRLNLQSLAPF